MNRQQGSAPMPAGRATPMLQQAAMPTQQMSIIPPAGAMPSYAPATPPYGGGNGGNPYKAKEPWYKRWWGITIIVLLIIGGIDYIFTPSKAIPDVVGQTVSEARTTLEKEGFEDITVKPNTKGKDRKWKVEEQTPEAGQREKTSTSITLTVKRDISDLPNIAKKGMMLDKAINALTDEGYSTSDYKIESDSGELSNPYSNWEVLSANNGVIRVHNKAADEEAARKAEEEKKAAEEQAKQQAEQQAQQQAADEEAARQAQQQAEQQQQQAQQQAEQQQAQQQQQANIYYPNCAAANAAGAAPIYRGQPGYSTKLDRDGDGVACDK